MARSAKILDDIHNTREEISRIVSLLSGIHPIKTGAVKIIKERPLESAAFAILLGVVIRLFSNKFKSLFKIALFVYAIKQNISYFTKFKK